ncbi:uncharacterized protein TNCV_1795691 [Trichonephila clavipes]|nr:uncharacterized protein TNCV_1795691 [Trichonephila clavipes]
MSLKTLYRLIDSSKDVVVRCPLCSKSMTFGHYYHQHAMQEHSLKNRKECVFCMGLQSWPHGERLKRENVKHVVECLKSFVKPQNNASTMKNCEDLDEAICDCQNFVSIPRDMLGRSKNMDNSILYESVFEKPDMWRNDGVSFSESSGLGKDVYGIVQRYLKKDLKWFHVMVKHDAFQIFCREMEKIQNEIVVLPFWCLCDGLMAGIAKVQHRHMIIACELQGQFECVWQRKFRYNIPNGQAKKRIQIENAFHLVRTIAYVSRQRASCDERIFNNLKESNQTSHFYINRPMHEHSIAFLCTLFPNGIERLLLEQNGRKNVVQWVIHAECVRDKWRNLKWVVPIKVTGWKFIHCQVPFNGQEERYLTLHGDKKIYFKPGYSLQILKDEMYVLSPKQQNVMKQLKEITEKVQMERDNYWKTIVAELKLERDVFKNEFKSKENEWKAERDVLKSERDTFKAERNVFKTERNVFKTERDNLLLENRGLRWFQMQSDSLQK